MRYLMTFSYDGSNYNGYQTQPGLRTIQNEIEKALTFINNKKKTPFTSAGRTDKGVHALGQKGHFDLDIDISDYKLKCALNSNLPSDIHVINVKKVSDDFHARYNKVYKEYHYIMNIGEYNPLERNYVYQYNRKLDIVSMQEASKFLLGKHDFKSFVSSEDVRDNYEREIKKIDIIRDNDKIIFKFIGDGFFKYQIRNMVGTLIQIGNKKRKIEDMKTILASKDRTKAGFTAHPEGLYLIGVNYEEKIDNLS